MLAAAGLALSLARAGAEEEPPEAAQARSEAADQTRGQQRRSAAADEAPTGVDDAGVRAQARALGIGAGGPKAVEPAAGEPAAGDDQPDADGGASPRRPAERVPSTREIREDLAAMAREQKRVEAALVVAGDAGPIHRGAGGMIWPVGRASVTGAFGENRGTHRHAGIDFPAPVGRPIRAAAAGRVVIAQEMGGYGLYTCIAHGDGLSTCYAHQSRLGVRVGDDVRQGEVIGLVGNTGRSTGPHLHFEVRRNGKPVDPLHYL